MKIAFVLYPQILSTAVSIPVEMFTAAYQASMPGSSSTLKFEFVGLRKGPIETTGGLKLTADYDFDDEIEADWIFIPPMWGTPWRVLARQTQLQNWVAKQYARGSSIIATGTGVGHLASAGLIDQKIATTHWYYMDRFQKRFPQVEFQSKHFITHQEGIYCAGSINAQTDLVLYFIEREFGKKALALIEKQFMHELKRDFSTPYYESGGLFHEDEIVSLAQNWIRLNFQRAIPMSELSLKVGQSERQLRRRFTNVTGLSPQQFLKSVRIEQAQGLLRDSNLSITDVGLESGFVSSAYFSAMFKKQTELTPGEYRKIVRQKKFSSE